MGPPGELGGTHPTHPTHPHTLTHRPRRALTESAFEACARCTTTRRTQNTLEMQIRLRRWRVRGVARWVKQNKMGMIEEYLREYISLHNPPPFYDCFCLPPLTPLTHHGPNRICISTVFWAHSTQEHPKHARDANSVGPPEELGGGLCSHPSHPHMHTHRPRGAPTEFAFEACAGCTTTRRAQNALDMQIRSGPWCVGGVARWAKKTKWV